MKWSGYDKNLSLILKRKYQNHYESMGQGEVNKLPGNPIHL